MLGFEFRLGEIHLDIGKADARPNPSNSPKELEFGARRTFFKKSFAQKIFTSPFIADNDYITSQNLNGQR